MAWLLLAILVLDLSTIKNEPNPEHRSELALQNADVAFQKGRDAYAAGNRENAASEFDEMGDSVDLAYESLEASGKNARHNPKFFKRAEMSTRELLRRLDGMLQSMDFADREMLQRVRNRVSDVHDNLLKQIMSKK